MLTKILLTALVIIACYVYIQYKRKAQANLAGAEQMLSESANKTPASFRWLAIGLLVASVLGAVGYTLYGWYDDQTLLNVRVINSQTGEVVNYQVQKGEMGPRSFITIHGQQVTIANSERMEVTEHR